MSRAPWLLILSSLLVLACQNEQTATGQMDSVSQNIVFSFHCEPQNVEMADTSGYSVYAIVEEYKAKLAEIDTCQAILREDYDLFFIPDEALAATGSTLVGRGNYFYALRDERQITIFHGSGNPGIDSQPIAYELLATYENGRFHFLQ